jgi:hypothetical protein
MASASAPSMDPQQPWTVHHWIDAWSTAVAETTIAAGPRLQAIKQGLARQASAEGQ